MSRNQRRFADLPYRLNLMVRDFSQRYGHREITIMMAQAAIILWLVAAILTAL